MDTAPHTPPEDRIAAAHAAHRAAYEAQERKAAAHWAACVAAGTQRGPFPGLDPYYLPTALSLTAGADYAARYFGVRKTAALRALRAAAAAGQLEPERSGRFGVAYGDGRGTAGGVQARMSITYDRYSRESIDRVAAAL